MNRYQRKLHKRTKRYINKKEKELQDKHIIPSEKFNDCIKFRNNESMEEFFMGLCELSNYKKIKRLLKKGFISFNDK